MTSKNRYAHLYKGVKAIGWTLQYLSDYSAVLVAPNGKGTQLTWEEVETFVARSK